jgi:filamentous hemagglutinin family protein
LICLISNMFTYYSYHKYFTALLPTFYLLLTTGLCRAQVSGDGTLSTQVTPVGNSFIITGGTQAGKNLFHSFSELSLLKEWSASFDSVSAIENIIARVTGNLPSNINGTIKANGSANLFLINPNGITFGRGARLAIGGSFIASTAEQLKFADGNVLSVKDLQAQPLLTVSAPTGLQFGAMPRGIITNKSRTLQVNPGQTIALLGGPISLKSSIISAPEGRIELGSFKGNSFVSLIPVSNGWTASYDDAQGFQDIQLSKTTLNVGNPIFFKELGLGDIQLQGRNISIADDSEVGGTNNSSKQGGMLNIKASGTVNISNSDLTTLTINTGSAGSISIVAEKLTASNTNSSQLSGIFSNTQAEGIAGKITINVAQSIELIGTSTISSRAFNTATGSAGNIQIMTRRLILQDGGQVSSSTFGKGDGGAVDISASESVQASGTGKLEDELVQSGIFAQTLENQSVGQGGDIVVTTNSLVMRDGAVISVAASKGSTGKAGRLNINASTVEISGAGSTIRAASETSQAGNVNIKTNTLTVQDGGNVSVSSPKGQAGDLIISANEIYLDNGSLTAETGISGPEGSGNIQLQNVKFLQLNNGSEISAEATEDANGGNIFIDAADGFVVGVPGGDSTIKASAEGGQGGNITITAKGIYGFVEGKEVKGDGINEIDASSDYGPSGTVQLNTPDVDPSQTITELPSGLVDASGMIMQRCSAPTAKTAQQPESSFIIAGRGGLPPNPNELLSSDAALVNLVAPAQPSTVPTRSTVPTDMAQTTPTQIVEAQGWIIDADGSIVLTAQVPTQVPYSVGLIQDSCFGP